MNTIQYKGKLFIFPKTDEVEPHKVQTDRRWFVAKNINKGYTYVNNLSYIWMNHKHYQLEYDPHIQCQLDEFN